METYRAGFLRDWSRSREQLLKLTRKNCLPKELNELIAGVGLRTELFLKSAVLPSSSPRNSFEQLVDLLSGPLPAASVARLHAFRKAYNKAKHDPSFSAGLLDTKELMDETEGAIEDLLASGLGLLDQPIPPPTLKRVYWLAAWDHYIGGDTELHITIPTQSEHWTGPPSLDTIYIDGRKWDAAKADLAMAGKLLPYHGIIPQKHVDQWSEETDFLAALAFEGTYKTLISCLAAYEMRQKLLYGLNRGDGDREVLVACLLALVDLASTGMANAASPQSIRVRAITGYALPGTAPSLSRMSTRVADLLTGIGEADRKRITGPIWANESEFEPLALGALSRIPDLPVIIDPGFRVVMAHS